jgi:hypothetical protein
MGRWMVCVGHEKCIQKFYLEDLKGRDQMRDIGVDERIILKWTIKKFKS